MSEQCGLDTHGNCHSFVSLLASQCVPIEAIAALARHVSTVVTEKVYRHELRPVLEPLRRGWTRSSQHRRPPASDTARRIAVRRRAQDIRRKPDRHRQLDQSEA